MYPGGQGKAVIAAATTWSIDLFLAQGRQKLKPLARFEGTPSPYAGYSSVGYFPAIGGKSVWVVRASFCGGGGKCGSGSYSGWVFRADSGQGTLTSGSGKAISWMGPNVVIPDGKGNLFMAGSGNAFRPGFSLEADWGLLDPEGNTLTQHWIGVGSRGYSISAVRHMEDGGYLLAAQETGTDSLQPGISGLLIIKVDSTGNPLWTERPAWAQQGMRIDGMDRVVPGMIIAYGGSGNETKRPGILACNILDDQYATKSTPFAFRLPMPTAQGGYRMKLLSGPPGMSVNDVGDVTWMPDTDPYSLEKIQVQAAAAQSTDTLTFYLHVNWDKRPAMGLRPRQARKRIQSHRMQGGALGWRIPGGWKRGSVFDPLGKRIRTLEPGSDAEILAWDGRTAEGETAPSGSYFLQLETASGNEVLRFPYFGK